MLPWLISIAAAVPLPADPDPSRGQICFLRTIRLTGSLVPFDVSVDGRPLGVLQNGTWFCVQAAPGSYEVATRGLFVRTMTLPSYGSSVGVTVPTGVDELSDRALVDIDEGQTVYLRARLGMKDLFRGELTWEAVDGEFFTRRLLSAALPEDVLLPGWPDAALGEWDAEPMPSELDLPPELEIAEPPPPAEPPAGVERAARPAPLFSEEDEE